MAAKELPIPSFFNPSKVGDVWRVPYDERVTQAEEWRKKYKIPHWTQDKPKIALMMVDPQITFCIPGFELFVGGRSGKGAVEDNTRLCEFIYRNFASLSKLIASMDTHFLMQLFHPYFLVNDKGEHPHPFSEYSLQDIENEKWMVNPDITADLVRDEKTKQPNYSYLRRHLKHYAKELDRGGRYKLTTWPYHALLGGIEHALVPAVQEACIFHAAARGSQTVYEIKGGNFLTENYAATGPEVLVGVDGKAIAQKNTRFIKMLMEYDYVFFAGQAKSHCVAWTIDGILQEIYPQDPTLAQKMYLLEDCTSPVVVPGVIDYTDEANKAFGRFVQAGMHVVTSTTPLHKMPGIKV